MIHPATQLAMIGPAVGLGLVARQAIPRGTVTWVRDPLDRVLPAGFVAGLSPRYDNLRERFVYRDERGDYVMVWDDARFMNHSCGCNCALTPFGFEIAIADIAAGAQLTNDYAMLNLEPGAYLACQCGDPNCRGMVGAEDRATLQARWDAAIALALGSCGAVAQPLLELLPHGTLAAALRYYGQSDRLALA